MVRNLPSVCEICHGIDFCFVFTGSRQVNYPLIKSSRQHNGGLLVIASKLVTLPLWHFAGTPACRRGNSLLRTLRLSTMYPLPNFSESPCREQSAFELLEAILKLLYYKRRQIVFFTLLPPAQQQSHRGTKINSHCDSVPWCEIIFVRKKRSFAPVDSRQ